MGPAAIFVVWLGALAALVVLAAALPRILAGVSRRPRRVRPIY